MAAPNIKLEQVDEDNTAKPADVSEIVNAYKPPTFKHKKKRWEPKKWEPIFDEMVLMSCLGKSQIEIARRFGYTTRHTNAILNSKHAQLSKRLILTKLQETIAQTIEQRIAGIKDKALTRIAQTLNDDKIFETAPMAVFDRSVTVLKGTGVLKESASGGSGDVKGNNIFINADDLKGIREGLAVANDAKRLNAPSDKKIEIDVTEPGIAAD